MKSLKIIGLILGALIGLGGLFWAVIISDIGTDYPHTFYLIGILGFVLVFGCIGTLIIYGEELFR